jgi:biotin synthase
MLSLDLIKKAKESALSGHVLDKENIVSLLQIDPESKECDFLGKTAREVTSVICKDRAYLWAAIGLDYRACPMNCDYCSLGEKWGLVSSESELVEEDVIALVNNYVNQNVRWIVLRTTQFYSLEDLISIAKKIRKTVPGKYELGFNVGEFDESVSKKMVHADLKFVYHTLRLREGIDTRFNPKSRLSTMEAVNKSSLNLVSLIEPLGIEHTNEEIADIFLTSLKYGATVTGVMERIPVIGTPLGHLPAISERRLAQVASVTRLAAGFHAPDICVHRSSKLAMEWGANVAVVETGAIPRDNCSSSKAEWNGFTPTIAKEWFESKGYKTFQSEKD